MPNLRKTSVPCQQILSTEVTTQNQFGTTYHVLAVTQMGE
jgi:hypothetical protein